MGATVEDMDGSLHVVGVAAATLRAAVAGVTSAAPASTASSTAPALAVHQDHEVAAVERASHSEISTAVTKSPFVTTRRRLTSAATETSHPATTYDLQSATLPLQATHEDSSDLQSGTTAVVVQGVRVPRMRTFREALDAAASATAAAVITPATFAVRTSGTSVKLLTEAIRSETTAPSERAEGALCAGSSLRSSNKPQASDEAPNRDGPPKLALSPVTAQESQTPSTIKSLRAGVGPRRRAKPVRQTEPHVAAARPAMEIMSADTPS